MKRIFNKFSCMTPTRDLFFLDKLLSFPSVNWFLIRLPGLVAAPVSDCFPSNTENPHRSKTHRLCHRWLSGSSAWSCRWQILWKCMALALKCWKQRWGRNMSMAAHPREDPPRNARRGYKGHAGAALREFVTLRHCNLKTTHSEIGEGRGRNPSS